MKKEKKIKEKKVKKNRSSDGAKKGGIKGFVDRMSTESALKLLATMFAISLVFTLCSSTIVRLAAVPGSLAKKIVVVPGANNNQNQNNTNNENHGGELPPSVIIPDTTSASLQVQGTTSAPTTTAPSATEAPTEAPTDSSSGDSSDATQAEETKPSETEEQTDSPATIKEKTNILKTYKKVVNAANKLKPGFTKTQYRTLDGAKGPLKDYEDNHPGFFITQEEAEKSPYVVSKFSDMSLFCLDLNSACLLDNNKASDALKSAKKENLDDGSVKITLVLRDEKDPKGLSEDNKPLSNTSALFPVESAETFKKNIEARQGLLDAPVDSVSLTYHDCTLELVYMPKTGKIVSLTQKAVYDCNVSYKVLYLIGSDAKGVITDCSVYTDFIY